MTDPHDYAGKHLRSFETSHYTFLERQVWFDRLRSILVPAEAEEFGDVSFWQAGMDWDKYASKARAVILRIGQNIWKDSEFEYNYTEAKRRHIAVGGYFFFDGRATPQQQANVITESMAGKSFELELFIDWEHNYNGPSEGLPRVVELMQKVEQAGVACRAVGLYSGYYWFIANSNATTNAAQYSYLRQRPLWLAWYAAASVVKVPAPWSDWTHWQYGTPAVDWGQPTSEVDMNKYNGTRDQFTARYIGEQTIPPDTGGSIMEYGRIKAFTNIRTSPPGGTYIDIGDLLAGDEVSAYEIRLVGGVEWWRLATWKRGGQAMTLPAAECWAYGVNIDKIVRTVTEIKIQLTAGSTVTRVYSDGTSETETA